VLGDEKRLDSCFTGIEPRRHNVLNREHGLESEYEMDQVGEVQERSEKGVGMGGCKYL
jgi:hypothetical protein